MAPGALYVFNTGAADVSSIADGNEVSGECGVSMSPNWPNPFQGSTRIMYEVPVGGHVRLEVYETSGRHVRTLVDDDQAAGRRSIVWDGKAEDGCRLPGGVYYLIINSGGRSAARKVILL